MARELIGRGASVPTHHSATAKGASSAAPRGGSGACLRRGWWLVVLAVVGLCVLPAGQANAAALTTVNWSVSNNQINATAVTYAYSFKTATAGTIKTITFAVSGAGLAGTPAIAN